MLTENTDSTNTNFSDTGSYIAAPTVKKTVGPDSLAQTIFELATKLIDMGYAVIPCVQRKAVRKWKNWDGFTSISELQRFAEWRSTLKDMDGNPCSPIDGLAVKAGRNTGFLSIDIDCKDGKPGYQTFAELEAKLGKLPATRTRTTNSGGKHLDFIFPANMPEHYKFNHNSTMLGEAIDVKGDGALVFWYPDYTDDTVAELPQAWLEYMLDFYAKKTSPVASREKKSVSRPVQSDNSGNNQQRTWVVDTLNGLVSQMKNAPNGKRNDTLNVCFFRYGSLKAADVLSKEDEWVEYALKTAAREGGQSHIDIEATAKSGLEAGLQKPADLSDFTSNQVCTTSDVLVGEIVAEPLMTIAPNELSEDMASEGWARHIQGNFIYCKPQDTWYIWTPEQNVWSPDRVGIVYESARLAVRNFNTEIKIPAGSSRFLNGVVTLAESDSRIRVLPEQLDSEPMLLNTPGGAIWLDGRTNDGTPDKHWLCTQSTSVAPEEGEPELFLECMHQWTNGDTDLQRHMQQMAGYALTGDTREQKFTFVTGNGGNGKSVWLNVMEDIMDGYAKRGTLAFLTKSGSSGATPDVAMLQNARLVTVSETEEDEKFNETLVKSMTGGDRITARFLHKNNFTFTPKFKIFIVSNSVPNISSVSDAMKRRLNIIPFNYKPSDPNTELPKLLRAEYPRILNWMIQGCYDWLQNGLVKPKAMIEATASYFAAQDLLTQWIERDCEIVKDAVTGATELYMAWCNFLTTAGENLKTHSQKKFGGDMTKVMSKWGFLRRETRTRIEYINIRLKSQPPPLLQH